MLDLIVVVAASWPPVGYHNIDILCYLEKSFIGNYQQHHGNNNSTMILIACAAKSKE